MIILSREPLSDSDINQVQDILRQSHCPNESLSKTFPRYSGIQDDTIFFDDAQNHSDVFSYPLKGDVTVNIKKPDLVFGSLTERDVTDLIVLHHTGADIDASAQQIHQWHLDKQYSGIGYHFVIRKDGTLEIGRPEWAVGAHAYGENWHSLGIHLSGDFDITYPTAAQIQTCRELIRDLCDDYNIPLTRNHIVGHCDLMATACPGKNFYNQINNLIK